MAGAAPNAGLSDGGEAQIPDARHTLFQPAPLEDRMSALRRVKRWRRRQSADNELFQILAHETPEERRSDLLRIPPSSVGDVQSRQLLGAG